MDEPDPHVVAAARRGDMTAFEGLVRRYQGDVFRFCLHLVSDRSLAEDVTQETFIRAYRFLGRYRGDSRFSTWLFSIARNCVQDEFRRAGRRARLVQKLEKRKSPEGARDETTGPEVREALATLPRELLEPIVMIDVFGFSYREVAEVTSTPEGTVKSRVHRARERLLEMLGPQTEEGADEI